MKKIENIPGKIQFIFNIQKEFNRMEIGWRVISFGVLKLNRKLKEGERITDYRGFYKAFRIFIPFEVID